MTCPRSNQKSKDNGGKDGIALQLVAAVEEGQFDEEFDFDDPTAELFDQAGGGGGGAAGGQQVVHEQHPLARLDGVGVQLERGAAIFQVVTGLYGAMGQFAGFAHERQAGVELERDAGAEGEATGLDDGHLGDMVAGVPAGQEINGGAQQPGIGEHRRDVFEQDAGLGEVGHVADGVSDVVEQHVLSSV